MRRLIMCLGVLAFVASTAMAGVSLIEIPPPYDGDNSEGRCITPDGVYVGGQGSSVGFVWSAANGSTHVIAGGYNSTASGIGYRDCAGTQEIVVHGLNSGHHSMNASTDGGLTWQKRRRTNWPSRGINIGAATTLAGTGTDVAYATMWSKDNDAQMYIDAMSGCWTWQVDSKGTPRGSKSRMHGVGASALAVGRRLNAGYYNNYKCQFDGDGGLSCTYFPGVAGVPANAGEGWAVSGDGTRIGGFAPIPGPSGNYPYVYELGDANATEMPRLAGCTGYGTNGIVYGISPDGDYAVGHNYPGYELAVLYDLTGGLASATVTDLTALADDAGVLGVFDGNLRRAYAVTVADNGDVMITGWGYRYDIWRVRGFLMTICTVPIILEMDVLPNDDPNNFTVLKKADSKARLPIEVYGSAEFDVADIDFDSIRVAGTVIPVKMQNDIDYNGDGLADLKVHLNRVDLINALDLSNEIGNVVDVVLTGAAVGGCPIIEATDSIIPVAPQ